MAQSGAADGEKPPGQNFLSLIEKQNIVSLEKFPQKEAFLVGQNLFNSHIDQFKIQIVTDIKACEDLFEKFSPKDTVFATWDFRYSWYLGYRHLPCFFVLYFNNQPVGLLPLWYEHDKNQFRWFGSYWMEDNTFWVLDKKYIPLLLAVLPPRTYLNAIYLEQNYLAKFLKLEQDDPKFILDLHHLSSLNDFWPRLKKKLRYNLKRDLRIITTQKPTIIINNINDLEIFFQLTNQRFQKGADCQDKRRKLVYQELFKHAKNYQTRLITVKIGDQVASVDIVFLYRDTYYAARGANNLRRFPGIGNFVNLYQIEEAIKMGYKKIDFLQDECGWKANLLEKKLLFYFNKELRPEEILL